MIRKADIDIEGLYRWAGFHLLGLAILPYILSYLLLIMQLHGPWINKLALFGGGYLVFLTYILYKSKAKLNLLLSIALSWLLFFLAFFISKFVFDFSFDGQGYHQEAIFSLTNGWNFLVESIPSNPSEVWINHYPKGQWLSASFYTSLFGDVEAAKLVNWLFVFAKLFFARLLLARIGLENKLIIWVLSLLIAFDPINLNTLLSHTNDGQVSSCIFLLLAILLLNYYDKVKYPPIVILLISVYAINIKFNALLYVSLIFFFYAGFFLIQKQWDQLKRVAVIALVSVSVGVSFFGFNPYVSNVINAGHIFYPVMGNQETEGKALASDYLPSNLKGNSNLGKLFKSTFGSTDFSQAFNKDIKYKIPFSLSKYELTRYAGTGVMIGGLGLWFSGLLILSLIAMVLLIRKKETYIPIYIIAAICISVIANPLSWWFRFVPQFWFIPIVSLIFLYKAKTQRKFAHLFLIALCVNSFLMLGYFVYNINASRILNNQLLEIRNTQLENKQILEVDFGRHSASFKNKLGLFDIRYIDSNDLNCKQENGFKLIEAKYCWNKEKK